MVGTWTPPGRIYTVQFDDEELTLTKVKTTDIPEDEAISWMTFSVRSFSDSDAYTVLIYPARQKSHLWGGDEEMELVRRQQPDGHCPPSLAPSGRSPSGS